MHIGIMHYGDAFAARGAGKGPRPRKEREKKREIVLRGWHTRNRWENATGIDC